MRRSIIAACLMMAIAACQQQHPARTIPHDVTWSVDESHWIPYPGPPQERGTWATGKDLVSDFRRILDDPRGWDRAVSFRHVNGNSWVTFRMVGGNAMITQCGTRALACTRVLKDGRCLIRFLYGYSPVGGRGYVVMDPVVNHELGHCFGFKHTRAGLMATEWQELDPSLSRIYPSKKQIAALKQRERN